MVVVNNHKTRVATVRVKSRLPNKKDKLLDMFVVTPNTRLNLQRLFPVQVGEHSGSIVISSNLEVGLYL